MIPGRYTVQAVVASGRRTSPASVLAWPEGIRACAAGVRGVEYRAPNKLG